jgi:hypothetical protein
VSILQVSADPKGPVLKGGTQGGAMQHDVLTIGLKGPVVVGFAFHDSMPIF